MKLYLIEFDTAMCHENQNENYIIRHEQKPTEAQAAQALHTLMYSGTIWINSIKETTEKEIRNKKNNIVNVIA